MLFRSAEITSGFRTTSRRPHPLTLLQCPMRAESPIDIQIPDGLDFADLKLARDPRTGDISFDWAPIEAICEASGIDLALFEDPDEDTLSELIVEWYAVHLANGGARDPVQEEMMGEATDDDSLG